MLVIGPVFSISGGLMADKPIPQIIIGFDGLARLLGVSKPQLYIYMREGMPGQKMPDLKSEDDWKEI